MNGRRRRGNLVAALGVLAGLLLALWPATAQAQCGGWEWQNPLPTGNWLRDVWGSSGSDVFAVGDVGTILHYDGLSWSAMSSGTTANLHGVWGSSGSDIFAVGDYGTILHYCGPPHSVYLPLVLKGYAPQPAPAQLADALMRPAAALPRA